MKKKLFISALLILVFALFLTGCTNNDAGNGNEDVQDEDPQIMEDFLLLVERNDPLEIKEYIDANIENVSQEEATEMINHLENSLVENLEPVTDRLFSLDTNNELIEIGATDFFFDEEKISEITNEELKIEVQNLFDSMYKLINIEGMYNPIIDYAKLQEYNDYITDQWKDFLDVKAMDSNNPPFVDGGLIIEYDDLADRIIKTENYLTNYTDGDRRTEMIDNYDIKMSSYLKGVPNTSIADYDSNIIHDNVMNSYIETETANHEDSITADILSRYTDAIEENERIIDDEILQLADELISEAVEKASE